MSGSMCLACFRLPRSRAGVALGERSGRGVGDGDAFCSAEPAPPRHETGGADDRKDDTKQVLLTLATSTAGEAYLNRS